MTAVLDSVQRERERITSELHDRAIKSISAVALRLEALVGNEESISSDDLSPAAAETVLDCVLELRRVDRTVRDILADTLHSPATPKTLKTGLIELVNQYHRRAPSGRG